HIGSGRSRKITSQHAAPATMATHTVSALPLARSTTISARVAPMHSGSKRTAMIVLTHFAIERPATCPASDRADKKACSQIGTGSRKNPADDLARRGVGVGLNRRGARKRATIHPRGRTRIGFTLIGLGMAACALSNFGLRLRHC